MNQSDIYTNTILEGDAYKNLKILPDQLVNMCVTSPPYWGLRDYGVKGQLGQESTPGRFISKMVKIFDEVYRVMKDDGTLWINIGDSYASKGKNRTGSSNIGRSHWNAGKKQPNKIKNGLKAKDLVGIPWMLAFALREAGWYLRQDIVWHKTNAMPESVKDRCTKAHEYIFLFSKKEKYYFDQDAILKDASPNTHARVKQNIANQNGSTRANGGTRTERPMKTVMRKVADPNSGIKSNSSFKKAMTNVVPKVNKRSVWSVATQKNSYEHFATFPEALIVDCIKAGCPEGGLVLDPFFGTGTTGLVARKLQRNYLGIELNPSYIADANDRMNELGIFK